MPRREEIIQWYQKLKEFVDANQKPDAYSKPDYWHQYDTCFEKVFVFTEPKPATSWGCFQDWLGDLSGHWGYRGQRESGWTLRTTLDRIVRVQYSGENCSGYYHLDRRIAERDLLFQFRQQAHQYIRHLPSDSDLASWFGLMQHYGVPTRLLDWTESPYVGMYFAIEEEAQIDPKQSAVWAIDLDWLEKRMQETLKRGSEEATALDRNSQNNLLDQSETPLVARIDPAIANERMFAQQGFFLWKLLEKTPFFDQILMTMMIHPKLVERPVLRKLEVAAELRMEFLDILRSMNVHRASLFPGLDGFCQSLKVDLEIKVRREAMRRITTQG